LNKSCLGCYYENDSVCYWFKLKSNSTPKKIPINIINKGCDKYKNDNLEKLELGLLDYLIKVFDGEIIGTKYKPPIKKRKSYKKKYVKSAHNYAYRKDAQ